MQTSVKETIIDPLSHTAVNFLQNDMSIEDVKAVELKKVEPKKYFSTVVYSGVANMTVVCIIDEDLLKTVFKMFIPYSLSSSETREMIKEMPNEVINIIAGLSIAKFPKPYDELEMTPPSATSKEYIEELLSKDFIGKKIETSKGDMQLLIV